MTLSEPYKTNTLEGVDAIPISIYDTKPIIETHIFTMDDKWKKLSLILDLGANHKILLLADPTSSNSFKKTTSIQNIAEGLGASIYGTRTFAKLSG